MLTELIREQKLGYILKYYNLDPDKFNKNRKVKLFLYTFLCIIFLLFTNTLFQYWFFVPIAALAGYKLPYMSLMNKKEKDDYLNAYLFPEFISSYIALIGTTGNTFNTFVATYPYVRGELRKKVKLLIKKLEESNDREHYLDLADYVNTTEAFMIMDIIYQFSEYGIKKETLKELEQHVLEIQGNRMDNLIDVKMEKMESVGLRPVMIALVFVVAFAGVLLVHYLGGVGDVMGESDPMTMGETATEEVEITTDETTEEPVTENSTPDETVEEEVEEEEIIFKDDLKEDEDTITIELE